MADETGVAQPVEAAALVAASPNGTAKLVVRVNTDAMTLDDYVFLEDVSLRGRPGHSFREMVDFLDRLVERQVGADGKPRSWGQTRQKDLTALIGAVWEAVNAQGNPKSS